MPAKQATSEPVEIRRLEEAILEIPIVGVTPVIPHRWSEKARRMMAEKQANPGVRAKREPKDAAAIAQERHDSCYWLEDGRPGMPSTAFKAATVAACRFYDGVQMVRLKTMVYVEGEGYDQLVPIDGRLVERVDTPRNSDGGADLRYRYMIDDWSATLVVHFYPSLINASSVISLVDAGGKGGVGDWRPSSPKSSTGVYGQYQVNWEALA